MEHILFPFFSDFSELILQKCLNIIFASIQYEQPDRSYQVDRVIFRVKLRSGVFTRLFSTRLFKAPQYLKYHDFRIGIHDLYLNFKVKLSLVHPVIYKRDQNTQGTKYV
jgi:hypothetical protein